MLNQRFAIAFLAVSTLVTSIATVAQADPVIIPLAVGEPLKGQGTGLCIAQAISQAPKTIDDSSVQQKSSYNGELNAFMEAHLNLPDNKNDHTQTVLRTLFDLSNNNITGNKASLGEFTNAIATCKLGGCNFIINDDTTVFGLRARGYLNVTPDLVNKQVHFGFYTDDAVSLTIYGPNGALYPVITREVKVFFPTWRVTNTVTFGQAGVYPLEILYMEGGDHAALEMSYLASDTFMDVEVTPNQDPNKLSNAGFKLFPPEMFSQTLSGEQSFPDVSACKQCPRQFANVPGNGTCDAGYYCNDAALCAPCDTAKICGPTCSPCGGDTPFCVNVNGQFQCGGCVSDSDCPSADPLDACSCDPKSHACVCEHHECEKDDDCAKGKVCENYSCTPCDKNNQCAGNSCNCCPKTADGKQLTCGTLSGDTFAACVECTSDGECDGKKCDPSVGRCVDKLPKKESPDCCGESCAKCPKDDEVTHKGWYCLPSHIDAVCAQCREDMDCGDGSYCRGGTCVACLDDRRCGTRCGSCGSDTPFCFGADKGENGVCVRCLTNDDCGGGDCDSAKHTCKSACAVSCGKATPYCYGDKCVECYADTQCPCGGTCNLETNSCATSCNDGADCPATDHCAWNDDGQTKVCSLGTDDAPCGSKLGQLCQKSSIGVGLPDDSPIALTGVALGSALLLVSRRRKRSSTKGNREGSAS